MTAEPSDRGLCAGRYRLERPLGRGPSGVVYAAVDLNTGQPCAVKRLHAQFHDEASLAAIQRDGLLATQVAHPVIVAPAFTGFEEDGTFYVVSELIAGESLRGRLLRGAMSPEESMALLGPLCAALEASHRAGLHHGDIAPGNVLCPPVGSARLTDFGMSRLGLSDSGAWGIWGGAAGYIPPEVYRGEISVATARADVFALGALLYECLTGQRLFDGPSAAAVMFKACMAPIPSLAPVLPPETDRARVDAVVAMACDKDPEARFDHAGALWRALQAVFTRTDEPVRRERRPTPPPLPLPVQVQVQVSASTAPPGLSGMGDDTPHIIEPELDSWADQAPPEGEEFEEPVRPRYGRMALWFGAGGVAMAALFLLLLRFGPFTPVEPPQVAAVAPPAPVPAPAPAPPPAPAPVQAPPVETPPPAETPAPTPAEAEAPAPAPAEAEAPQPPADPALLQAEKHYLAGDYVAALSAAEETLQRAPSDPAALDLSRRAKEAMRHKAVLDGFLRAAERGDIDTAVALYRELPAASPFRQKAQEAFGPVQKRYTDTHLQIANAALHNGACEEVQRQVDQVVQLLEDPKDPDAERGRRLLTRCRRPRTEPRPDQKAERARPVKGIKAEEEGELKNPFATRSGKSEPRP